MASDSDMVEIGIGTLPDTYAPIRRINTPMIKPIKSDNKTFIIQAKIPKNCKNILF